MKLVLHGASYLSISVLFLIVVILSGCGEAIQTTDSSNPQQDSTVTALQLDNQRLQDENTQLKRTNSQLEQDKKALNAKVADVTSKLGQSSSQWQDLQDLQFRVNQLDSELTVEKQINRDMSARLAGSEKPGTPVTSSAEFKKAYNHALSLHNAKKYKEAITDLQNLAGSSVNDPLMSNVHYWLGECFYATKQYNDALKEFQKTLTYPKTFKAGAGYIMLGMTYLRLGDKENARATWQSLIDKYPKSRFTVRAKEYMKQL